MIAWIDRNWNRWMNWPFCIKIDFKINPYTYNDIVTNGTNSYRYLGNNWFKYIGKLNKIEKWTI